MGGEEGTGYVGGLDDKQKDGLKEMWQKFFAVTKDKKPPMEGVEMKKGAGGGGDDEGGGDGEDAFGGKAKDDKAKDQQAAKAEKKELTQMLSEHGPEELRAAFWSFTRGEHPDGTMLRFCRARKWDINRAFAMLAAALKFRIEFGVEEVRAKGEEGLSKEEGFQLQYDKGKAYIHGTDKHDRPVVFIHVAKHNPKEQSQKSLERFTIFNMETSRALIAPPVTQGTLVFDMTNFGLSNMDWACVSFIVKCFEAYYPETLGLCLIHKAPMVFNAIWKILRPMLDPVVRSKIDFTNSEADLAKHIDPKHLSKGMGGEDPWKWRFDGVPEGENKIMENKEEKEEKEKLYDEACENWEELTQKWIDGDDKAFDERNEKAFKVFIIRHLDLDPYIRGKTIYSRSGINVGDGRTIWKYAAADDEEFGKSADEWAEELGIEGKRPRYDQEEQIEVSDSEEEDDSGPPPGGKVGAMAVGMKRKTANSVSKVTPGPSNAEKEKEKEEAKKKRRQEKIEKKRKEIEEEKRQKEQNEEDPKDEEGADAAVHSSYQSYLNSVKDAAGSVYNGAGSAAGKAADYVPATIGGDTLKIKLKHEEEGGGEEGGKEE